ncbi:MAG: GAF domain-containing protein [Anaerolineales bacterium]|nr:GAF domain-containing protein [Chloroflexota bacterium]MBL6979727.1 GAF domain-containing protein [Anaerolineales bacterium]
MSQAIPAAIPKFRGKLARTMLTILIPIALVPLMTMGGLAYARSRQILINQIESTLISIESQQQQKIETWIETRQERINYYYVDPTMVDAFQTVSIISNNQNSRFIEARDVILTNLEEINANEDIIHQFFVLSPEGEILVSTNQQYQGISVGESAFFEQLSTEHANLAVFKPEPIHNSLAIITARPYYTIDGEHLVTIWGLTGLSRFETLFKDITFLGIRVYLITEDGKYIGLGSNIKEVLSGPVFQPSVEQTQLFSSLDTDTTSDVIEFTSFDDEEVMAVFLPIPEFKAGLVIEIPTTDIIRQLQNLPYFGLLLAGTIIFSGLLTWLGTRRIVEPILEISDSAQHFSEGDWQKRAAVSRNDEIGLLAYSFNQMADELSTLYRSLETQVITRTEQVRTAAEVAQIATSAADLDTVLQQTVKLIIERFGYYYAAVFLLDESKENAILKDSYSSAAQGPILQGYIKLPVGEGSIIGMVSASNQYYIAADVVEDPYYLPVGDLPDTRSEAVIPLSIGDSVIGVLDVQSHRANAFEADSIATLQTLANHIATVLQNYNLLESTRVDLQATSALYQASHTIAEAETKEEVFQALSNTLENIPLISALFEVKQDELVGLSMIDPIRTTESFRSGSIPNIPLSTRELAANFENAMPLMVTDEENIENFPRNLLMVPRNFGCQSFAFLPIMPENELRALLILGEIDASKFSQTILEPYTSLVDITRTALEKVSALDDIQKRLVEMETISTVGQSISTETNLNNLYQITHHQIIQVMGEVNFLIAHYSSKTDMVEIPYLVEGGEITTIPSFPLGQGLTSIIIRTKQPLMIVEDTVNRSRALGAIVTDSGFAKSWLGVPLLVANEPIGAIVVQDLENEHRFDEDDMRLLVTLASQVAIAIRNARLLENTLDRAEQERKLFDITTKIRRSPDMQTILKTTVQEISEALGAHRTQIKIAIDQDFSDGIPTNGDPGEEESIS